MPKPNAQLSWEKVRARFEKKGYTLLSCDYKGVKEELYYRCSCGNNYFISLDKLPRRVGCSACSPHKRNLSIEDVRTLFADLGHTLLSTEYKNQNQRLEYICKCGQVNYKTVQKLPHHKHCPKCKPNNETQRTIEEIRLKFSERGFVLLSEEYINYSQKLKFLCKCGRVGFRSGNSLQWKKDCEFCFESQQFKNLSLEEQRARRSRQALERINNNPNVKIKMRIATRIYHSLKSLNVKKHQVTINYLGCSIEFLKSYLATKFTDGMSWDNYGKDGWHIDHIIPCAAFNLTDPVEQEKCFHYTNLQPLWAKDNLSKNSKLKGTRMFHTKNRPTQESTVPPEEDFVSF